ncbi:MAG: hypothetical protein M3235_05830 [Actinomycetota bacterium]|nr:hypothetical protein [Actinomycetota bacterium]
MLQAGVAELARLLRDEYSPEALDPGVDKPTVVDHEHGFRSVAVPRSEMPEPWRSFRLLDAAALDRILVVTFTWDDGSGDDTVFLLPLDTRDVELDLSSERQVTTFLTQLIEFTVGGPRETWEPARSTPLSPRLAVVRPYWSAG